MLKPAYKYVKIMRNPWKNMEELKKIQEKMVKTIVQFAYHNTRFYKEKFKKAGIHPSDLKTLDDMKKIPISTKDEVRSSPESLYAVGYNEKNCVFRKTTGSTGKIIPILQDKEAYFHFNAVGFRMFWDWGYRPWEKIMIIRHESDRKSFFEKLGLVRRYYVPIATPEEELVKIMNEINPKALAAYPSTVKAIMNVLEEGDLKEPSLKFIMLNSEILTEQVRNQTKETFKCDVFDEYSTYEVDSIAHECPLHGFHLDADNVLVDFLDNDNEEVSYGERGNIIVTSLVNKAMPFIRYELGDIGVPLDETCVCGRTFPLMRLVEGRVDDFLVMPTGELVSPRKVVTSVEVTEGIEEFQIIQEKRDYLKIFMKKNEKCTPEEERKMMERLQQVLTKGVKVEVEHVDKVPRTKGKLRIVKTKVRS